MVILATVKVTWNLHFDGFEDGLVMEMGLELESESKWSWARARRCALCAHARIELYKNLLMEVATKIF